MNLESKIMKGKRNTIIHNSKFNIRKSEGFTLIEMIVAVSIFTVVMFVTVGALLAIADANRKANSLRTTMDNLNFAMEAMTRDIRTGDQYDCGPIGGDKNCSGGEDTFTYEDQDGVPTTYRYENGTIEVKAGDEDEFTSFTSPEIDIESLTFFVTGVGTSGGAAGKQPFVTITIKGTAGINARTRTEFNVQTSVSQRRVEG